MKEKIRVGFVGAGFAANFHYESLLAAGLVNVEVVGVFSKRKESRERYANARGIKAFNSMEELLESVDSVHVCVPPALHEYVTVEALKRDVNVIVEKPFTGFFGPGGSSWGSNDMGETLDPDDFRGDEYPKDKMRDGAIASARRMVEAESRSKGNIYYAENWVYTPVVQKEVEIIKKTKAQLLWIIAEESHSGSHSPTYGIWRYSGGGSIMGKGTHPLTTVLYLKRVEGLARSGKPIRPKSVTARTHEITRLPGYIDKGFLRTDYKDVEDFAVMHLVFEDGTVSDIFSSEIVLGGVHNWLEVFANNHRTRCNINPIDALETYNPLESQFDDIYVVEKIGTKQGWSKPAPDENWMNGYVQELRDFYLSMSKGEKSLSSSQLAFDTVSVIYSAYLSAEERGKEVEIVA